jgi:tetratricopeptide (TPR) repeat protein
MKESRRQFGLNSMLNYVRIAAYLLAFAALPTMAQVPQSDLSAPATPASGPHGAGLSAAGLNPADPNDVQSTDVQNTDFQNTDVQNTGNHIADNQSDEDQAAEIARARLAARQSLQQRINILETESGPYAANLIEVHFDLGRIYQAESLYQEAAASFANALQLVRISEGLYSERQTDVLEQLISVNQAAENWPEVDNNHHLLFQINKQLHQTAMSQIDKSPVDNSAWAAAVIEFGEWRLYASRNNLLRRSSAMQAQELEQVHALYSDAIKDINETISTPGDGDSLGNALASGGRSVGVSERASLVSLLYGKARAEHEIAQYLMRMPPDYFAGQGSPYNVRTVCFPVAASVAPAHSTQALFLDAVYEADNWLDDTGVGDSAELIDIAQTGTGGTVQRVCTSERVENPAYRASQRNEQRMRLDRAAMNMRATIQDLHAILEQNVVDSSAAQVHRERLAELNQMQQALVRDSRRNISRWGW